MRIDSTPSLIFRAAVDARAATSAEQLERIAPGATREALGGNLRLVCESGRGEACEKHAGSGIAARPTYWAYLEQQNIRDAELGKVEDAGGARTEKPRVRASGARDGRLIGGMPRLGDIPAAAVRVDVRVVETTYHQRVMLTVGRLVDVLG